MVVKPTQTQQVWSYIIRHGSITPLQAIRDLGVMRLAARIADLRQCGGTVLNVGTTVTNRYGQKVRIAKYVLAGELKQEEMEI